MPWTSWPNSTPRWRSSWTCTFSAVCRSERSPRCAGSASARCSETGARHASSSTTTCVHEGSHARVTAPLDPTKWDALSAVLAAARELDPAARAAWLAERRREQPDVAAQLERLLARETQADAEGFLDPTRQQSGGDL